MIIHNSLTILKKRTKKPPQTITSFSEFSLSLEAITLARNCNFFLDLGALIVSSFSSFSGVITFWFLVRFLVSFVFPSVGFSLSCLVFFDGVRGPSCSSHAEVTSSPFEISFGEVGRDPKASTIDCCPLTCFILLDLCLGVFVDADLLLLSDEESVNKTFSGSALTGPDIPFLLADDRVALVVTDSFWIVSDTSEIICSFRRFDGCASPFLFLVA